MGAELSENVSLKKRPEQRRKPQTSVQLYLCKYWLLMLLLLISCFSHHSYRSFIFFMSKEKMLNRIISVHKKSHKFQRNSMLPINIQSFVNWMALMKTVIEKRCASVFKTGTLQQKSSNWLEFLVDYTEPKKKQIRWRSD